MYFRPQSSYCLFTLGPKVIPINILQIGPTVGMIDARGALGSCFARLAQPFLEHGRIILDGTAAEEQEAPKNLGNCAGDMWKFAYIIAP